MISRIISHLICNLIGHRWRFIRISLEGGKVFRCRRCDSRIETPRY